MTEVGSLRRYTVGLDHVDALSAALEAFRAHVPLLERWGASLAEDLPAGARLLAVGNGGSAAQAQHLTAEIVGRYCDDRTPLSALALHTEPSAFTAILNDFGPEEVFARQVAAHGRPGDVCVLLSTSGTSANVVAAARRAAQIGVRAWAITGPAPNPLADVCDEVLAVEAAETAIVQELHLVALHLLCAAMDNVLLGTADSLGTSDSLGRGGPFGAGEPT
jgi:D-sedoheptulose 7-phosphate isomerase